MKVKKGNQIMQYKRDKSSIDEIANIISQNGGRLYLVGGAVRDELLNKTIHDEDYCVVGIDKETFKNLFPDSYIVGKSFNVFQIDGNEFALARKERKTGIGHKEFEITTGKEITIVEDLKRRDLTINSIAKDVISKEIIDPFDGKNDIKNKSLRATSDAFKEDPLRVYRVARFASQLNFSVEKNTIKMMSELKDELFTLSKERVFVELYKALKTDKPSIFFDVLRDADVLDVHFKEIYNLIGSLQPIKYHPEGDSYNHTMLALDNSAKLTKNLLYRYSALVHDLGKGLTPKEMYPHHYGHDERGVKAVRELSNRIGVPNAWKKAGIIACREHMKGGIFLKMKPSKQVEFIERVNKSILGLEGLQIVVYSDRTRNEELSVEEKKECTFIEIGNEVLKNIDGKYIKERYNIRDGIEFGEKLHKERVNYIKKLL